MYKRVGIALVMLGLAACGAPRPRPPAPQTPNQPTPSLQPLPAPGTYRIDSSNSELRVLVYRAERSARLGHNHVLVNRAVGGSVQVGATLAASLILDQRAGQKFHRRRQPRAIRRGRDFRTAFRRSDR